MKTPVVREISPAASDPFAQRRPARRQPHQRCVGELVCAARGGDAEAWAELRRRFAPLFRRVAGGFGLCPYDADEVEQNTWLRLLENGLELREPRALAGWLDTTARRESLRLLQRSTRETPTEELFELQDQTPSAADIAVATELAAILASAVHRLPDRQRQLLTAKLRTPGCGTQELARITGLPVGSVGPTVLRALERLRRDPTIAQLDPAL